MCRLRQLQRSEAAGTCKRRRLNIAGRDITTRLVDLLQRRGHCFNAAADFDTVRSVKERACYVAADYQRELQASDCGALHSLQALLNGCR